MENRSLFEKYFKLTFAHRKDEFSKAIKSISGKSAGLHQFSREIEWVSNLEKKLDKEWQQRLAYYLQFSPDQLIFAFLLVHQEMKTSPSNHTNWHSLVALEIAMWDEMSDVLKEYASKSDPKVLNQYFTDQEKIDREWHYFAKKEAFEKQPEIQVPLPTEYRLLTQLISTGSHAWFQRAITERYLAGLLNISFQEDGTAKPIETPAAKRFEYDDRKSSYSEKYFCSVTGWMKTLVLSTQNSNLPPIQYEIKVPITTLEFFGEPTTVTYRDEKTDLAKVFLLLQAFSAFKGPARLTVGGKKFLGKQPSNTGPVNFRNHLGPNESFSIFHLETLAKKVATVFNWKIEETQKLLDYLTWDIAGLNPPSHWREKPFLKIGDQIYWTGQIFLDRNWTHATHLRLRSKDFGPQFKNVLSARFEESVKRVFDHAGFKTLMSHRFKTQSGKSGDVDVIAFKNNCI